MADAAATTTAPPPPPHHVTPFDLDAGLEEEGDALLDWEAYAARPTLCGRALPPPPTFWLSMPRRTRRSIVLAGLLGIAAAGLFAGAAAVARAHAWPHTAECRWREWRLPGGATPAHYNLTWDIELEGEAPRVTGRVDARFATSAHLRCAVLHAASNVDITSAAMAHGDRTVELSVSKSVKRVPATQQIIVALPSPGLPPDALATLSLAFAFPLVPALSGLYLSTWSDADTNTTNRLALTQFEANAARKAVPCWDEPALKARWTVTLITEKGVIALTNMPIVSSTDTPTSRVAHTAQTTPPMASYLLATVVGTLAHVTATVPPPSDEAAVLLPPPPGPGASPSELVPLPPPTPVRPRELRVWGIPPAAPQLTRAARLAAVSLVAHERALRIAYSLPKLDLVAVPDFSAGAMENWGLIIFKEAALLLEEDGGSASPASSASSERRVALTIAHELAHLWTGDLVTTAAWGTLWLNEGFARYLEHVGAAAAAPRGAVFDAFWPDTTSKAMRAAARLDGGHALTTPESELNTDAAIESMFDATEYEGGATVIRMLRAYARRDAAGAAAAARDASQDAFLDGVHSYLKSRAYQAATPADLWSALEASMGGNVSAWTRAWERQRGVPLIRVARDAATGLFTVTQAPCVSTGRLVCGEHAGVTAVGLPADGTTLPPWWIPLHVRASDGDPPWWADPPLSSCTRPEPLSHTPHDWVLVNAGGYVPARVAYDEATAAALATAAAAPHSPLSADDVSVLLDDAGELAGAGIVPASRFWALTKALAVRAPPELAPWRAAAHHISAARARLAADPGRSECVGHMDTFLLTRVLAAVLAPAGPAWSLASTPAAATTVARLLRPLALGLAADAGDPALQTDAVAALAAGVPGQPVGDPDARRVLYESAVAGDPAAAPRVRAIHAAASRDAAERERALLALAAAPDVRAELDYSLTDAVKAQDAGLTARAAARRGGAALDAALTWLVDRHAAIAAKRGADDDGVRALGRALVDIGGSLGGAKAAERVRRAASAIGLTGSRDEADALARVAESQAWLAAAGDGTCAWLKAEVAR